MPLHPVSGPCSWEAADYSDPASYTTVLSERDVSELVSAIAAAEDSVSKDGSSIERAVASREDFPLPTLGPKLVALAEEAKNGRGFVLVKGFPVEKLTRQQAVIGYFGLGLYWGNARPNNKRGHLVGHIRTWGTTPPCRRRGSTRPAPRSRGTTTPPTSCRCFACPAQRPGARAGGARRSRCTTRS